MHWFPLLGSLKNLTTRLIWLVTRVGGWGEAWGGGPWRAGKGGDGGGGTREQCGSNKNALVPPFGLPWGGAPESSVGATKMHWFPLLGSLKNLTTGLIWLMTKLGDAGEAWGGNGWGEGVGGVGQEEMEAR